MSEKIFNVLDFGAKANGVDSDTAAVRAAIDACHEAGGGKVFFPKKQYVLATIFLKDNVHIEFEEGAIILGDLDFYSYEQQEYVPEPYCNYQDASHTYFNLAMFLGRNAKNIAITGKARINMRSVWDLDRVRGVSGASRGPKCISLCECDDVLISDLTVENATDLAIYFAACNNVDIHGIKMWVYIDGISPDNSKNVKIYDCDIESGDDAIVFKSTYNLGRIDICKNIEVRNCRLTSRCNAIKFGTETFGGFEDILIEDIEMRNIRISGIAIESVDGAIIDGVTVRNVNMENVNAPIFIHLSKRNIGPADREIGSIRNVTLENINADGPYEPYMVAPWSRTCPVRVYPWIYYESDKKVDDQELSGRYMPWQFTSNCCGVREKPLENITLRNINLKLAGGVKEYNKNVYDVPPEYPEVMCYGRILPAKGIYFRYINGLTLENIKVDTYYPDARENDVVLEHVN